ncbi:MAG: RNA 2',3'-cyclic phosphodiesterase [Planctomycetia bacterium]|nr:RNA 2',3'-cyclic phosphodiesterase [Planctomycetia bacterium]
MDDKIRTFVGLEIGEKSRQQAFELGQKLAQSNAVVKWEPAHKLHVTLKFLGEVPNVEVYTICREVQRAVRGIAAFPFCLQGAGAFPKVERPRSVWVGVDEGREALTQLARRVDEAMQGLGFPRELRPFVPHVTLGRVQRTTAELADLSRLIQQYDAADVGKTFARHVTIFASQMARTGSQYTILATAPLAGEF